MTKSILHKLIIITSLGFLGSNVVYLPTLAKSELSEEILLAAGKNNYLDTQTYNLPDNKKINVAPPEVIFNQPNAPNPPKNPQPISNYKTASLNVQFAFPLTTPRNISSPFGWRRDPLQGISKLHEGVDFAVPIGTPILAVADGEVTTGGNLNGYGLVIIIQHDNNTRESRYAHMSQIWVKPGQQVKAGTVIGLSGNTGRSTGPHLHFEWLELHKGQWVATDPSMLLTQARSKMLKESANKIIPPKPPEYSRAPRELKSSPVVNNFPVQLALNMPNKLNSILRSRFFGLPEHLLKSRSE